MYTKCLRKDILKEREFETDKILHLKMVEEKLWPSHQLHDGTAVGF